MKPLPCISAIAFCIAVLATSTHDAGRRWSSPTPAKGARNALDRFVSGKSENAFAQTTPNPSSRSRGGFGGRGSFRRAAPNRDDYPNWQNDLGFSDDVFTFARIRYSSAGYAMRGRAWDNDFPDCDWNFSVRLHELTSMKVDPNGVVIELTDPSLFDYPFVYMSNVGNMVLSPKEAAALSRYLRNGGFLMADDFWAPEAWDHVRREMENVFPDLRPRELRPGHEIFHSVYHLKGKPQVPSIRAWQRGHTFEYWHGDPRGDEGPHFWGYFDEQDRLMALMCHNNDIGDGWEREGENEEYFRNYSVRVSYPLGINIVTYAMTH